MMPNKPPLLPTPRDLVWRIVLLLFALILAPAVIALVVQLVSAAVRALAVPLATAAVGALLVVIWRRFLSRRP